MNRDNPQRDAGFTLVEVVIALLLFGIACAASLQLTAWAVRANAFSLHTTEAMNVAQDKMEELLLLGASGISAGNDAEAGYQRSWAPGYQGMTGAVSVVVSWKDTRGKSHSVRVSNIAE